MRGGAQPSEVGVNGLVDLNALPLPALFDELARGGLVRRIIALARDEDLGDVGDVTTRAWSPPTERLVAVAAARREGIIAGLAAGPLVMEVFAPGSRFEGLVKDGSRVGRGVCVARVEGPTREVLAAERTLLNLIGRLSGVATLTSRFVDAIGSGVKARLFDTRKTTPGLRVLEKYAVRCGGGWCHRLGLFDAVLVKDNHVARVPLERLAAHAAEASRRARGEGSPRFVEFEADRLEQVAALLTVEPGLIDVILLDNMPPAMLREAVAMRDAAGSGVLLEASGGVRLDTVRAIAETGVDRISAGAVTHSAVSLDVGLDAA